MLVDVLARDYDLDHEIIIYTAATLPTQGPKFERVRLNQLPHSSIDIHATVVIPPARLVSDLEIRARLTALEAALT